MFKKFARSRRNRNKQRSILKAERRRRTRLILGCETLEERRLLAATVLPFVAVADFNQFSGAADTPLGFGVDDGVGGLAEADHAPKFLGFEFDKSLDIGGFVPGFRSGSRWGAEASIEADGRLGLEYGYYISKGEASIINEGSFQYEIVASPGGGFDLLTSSAVVDSSLKTVSPTISAYADLVAEIDGSIAGEACAGIFGCADGTIELDVDKTIPLISVNRQEFVVDGNGDNILDGNGDPTPLSPLSFDGDIKLLDTGIFGDALDLVDAIDEARNDLFDGETDEKKALSDLKNAKTPEEAIAAGERLNEARAKMTDAERRKSTAAAEIEQEASVPKDDNAGFGLSVGPADNGLLGVNVAIGAEVQVGAFGAAKDFGSLTVTLPEVNLLDRVPHGGDLFASTEDGVFDKDKSDLARLELNIGTLLSTYIPGLGTTEVSIGPINASLTTVEYVLGATLDVTQDFEADFNREIVTATFDRNVNATGDLLETSNGGKTIRFINGASVKLNPSTTTGTLDVDFLLEREYEVTNNLGLGFGLDGEIIALAASLGVSFGPLDVDLLNLGPLYTNSHDLYAQNLPIIELDPYDAKPAFTFDTQTVIISPDIEVEISGDNEVVVIDDGLASHRAFEFDATIDNIGLQDVDSNVVVTASNLQLFNGSLDNGSPAPVTVTDGNLEILIDGVDDTANWTITGNTATRTLSPSNGEHPLDLDNDAIVFSFSGFTDGIVNQSFAATVSAPLSVDADPDNNSATSAIPILETRRYYVGSGSDAPLDPNSPLTGSSCTIQISSSCTLREAIDAASKHTGLQPTAVQIDPSVDVISLVDAITGIGDTRIIGNGSDETNIIATVLGKRIFEFAFGDSVVRGVTLSNAQLNDPGQRGAAIFAGFGSLHLKDVVFQDNLNLAGEGGAIAAATMDLIIEDSRFERNVSSVSGGAIDAQLVGLQISNTEFLFNDAPIGAAINIRELTGFEGLQSTQLNDVSITGSQVIDLGGNINANGGVIHSVGTGDFEANSLVVYNNTGNNFFGLNRWANLVRQNGAGYAEANIDTTVNIDPNTEINRDIGFYEESTDGGISYEFIFTASESPGSSSSLLGRRDTSDENAALKLEQFSNSGKFGVTVFGGNDFMSVKNSVFDTRTHVVFIADGTDMQLYVNGVLEDTIAGASVNLSGLVGLGHSFSPGGTFDVLGGTIHGVAVYDRALTENEIAESADAGLATIKMFGVTSDDESLIFDQELGDLQSNNVDFLAVLSFDIPLTLTDVDPINQALFATGVPNAEIADVVWQVPSREFVDSVARQSTGGLIDHPDLEIVDGVLKLRSTATPPSVGQIYELRIEGIDTEGRSILQPIQVKAIAAPVPVPVAGITAELFAGIQVPRPAQPAPDPNADPNIFTTPPVRTFDNFGDFANVSWTIPAGTSVETEYVIRAEATDNRDLSIPPAERGLIDSRIQVVQAGEFPLGSDGGVGFVNLRYDTEYTFSVETVNFVGTSVRVESTPQSTRQAPPADFASLPQFADPVNDPTGQKAPTLVARENESGVITVIWGESARASGYQVFVNGVAETATAHFTDFGIPCLPGAPDCTISVSNELGDNSFSFQSVPDTEYRIVIQAINGSGISEGVVDIESDLPKPTAPENVSVTVTSPTSALIRWADSRNESQYQIIARADGESEFTSLIDVEFTSLTVDEFPTDSAPLGSTSREADYTPIPSGATSFLAEGLLPGKNYEFIVIAANEDNDAASTTVTGSTLTEAPSLLVTTASDIEIDDDFVTSLREAIQFANEGDADGDGSLHDTIIFDDLGAFATQQTILLGSELPISQDITIVGSNGVILSGSDSNRIFNASGSSDLTLQSLHLTDGLSRGSLAEPGNSVGFGGAVLAANGEVTLINSRIDSSTALHPSFSTVRGGAIHATGDVKLFDSFIVDNVAIGDDARGGGISSSSSIELTNSLIDQNEVDASLTLASVMSHSYGGGLFAVGNIKLTESTVSGNTARGGATHQGGGGGIATLNNSFFAVSMTRSVVSDNQTVGANSPGGGIHAPNTGVSAQSSTVSGNSTLGAGSHGGGFHVGFVQLTNATVASNQTLGTAADGGGIHTLDTSGNVLRGARLFDTTVTANTATGAGGGVHAASSSTLANALVIGNFATNGENNVLVVGGAPIEIGNNLFGGSAVTTIFQTTVAVGGGVLGGVLGNNGVEPTLNSLVQTVALKRDNPTNPALDRNPSDPNLSLDARGRERSVDLPSIGSGNNTRDLGSFELEQQMIVDSLSESTNLPGFLTLSEAILAANVMDGPDTIVFAQQLSGQIINLTTQLPVVSGELLIDASSLDRPLTIAGSGTDRLLSFDATGDLELNHLVLTGGKTTGNNAGATDNTFSGGAIHFDSEGTLTLTNTKLENNSTSGTHARGGAIFASDASTVILTGSTLTNNHTEGEFASGGAIHGGTVKWYGSNTISENHTTSSNAPGGAVFAGEVFVNHTGSQEVINERSTVFDSNYTVESRSSGGALYSTLGGRLSGVTFIDNHTQGDFSPGGAVRSEGGLSLTNGSLIQQNHTRGENSGGGGISGLRLTIVQSSVVGNQTRGPRSPGGGLLGDGDTGNNQDGFVFLTDVTVANNSTRLELSPGGGVSGAGLFINQSTLSNNSTSGHSSGGGGAYGFQLGLNSSTVTGNSTHTPETYSNSSPGGGIHVVTLPGGSGSNYNKRASVYNSIVLGNYSHNSESNDLKLGNYVYIYGVALIGSSPADFAPGITTYGTSGVEIGYVANADPATVFNSTVSLKYDSNFDGTPDTTVPVLDANGGPVLNANGEPVVLRSGELANHGGGLLSVGLNPDILNNIALDRGNPNSIPGSPTDIGGSQRVVQLTAGATVPAASLSFAAADPPLFLKSQNSFFAASSTAASSNSTAPGVPSFGVLDLGSNELQSLTPEQQRLVVDTLEDVSDPLDLRTSLREAIALADAGDADGINGELDLISFSPSLAGQTITLVDGELDISQSLIIDATNIGGITIDAHENSRVVHFDSPSGNLQLKSLTLVGGNVTDEAGGGVRFDSSGVLTLTSSRITDNQTTGDNSGGGGVYSMGNVVVEQSLIDENSTSGNDSAGGGLLALGRATINNSTIYGNSTTGENSSGGGVSAERISLTNATVVDNSVLDNQSLGGGLHSTISSVLRNSIVLGNRSTFAALSSEIATGSIVSFEGPSLVGEGPGTFDASSTSAENALLSDVFDTSQLAANGGLTPTVALKPSTNNPALDVSVFSGSVGSEDQRGLPRSVDLPGITGTNQIDLGAYELQAGIEELPGLVVTTDLDDVDAFDFATSLREAIAFANSATAGDAATGDADNDGLAIDTITFADDLSDATLLLGSQLTIASSVNIVGNGMTIDASGSNQRIFDITDFNAATQRDVRIANLTLTGGGTTALLGGGILNRENLSLTNVHITNNTASRGGGIYSTGPLSLSLSSITDNHSSGNGGGLDLSGDTSIADSVIGNNSTDGDGGGLRAFADLEIRNSTIHSNTATNGAGLRIESTGDVSILQTTISGNTALDFGGGIINLLILDSGEVVNSTITGNRADFNGGGQGAGGVFDNFSTLNLHNTIVAGNFKGPVNATPNDIESGIGAASSFNLIGSKLGFVPLTDGVNGNIVGVNNAGTIDTATIFAEISLLNAGGKLADNGGPVPTAALRLGNNNPALDAGSDALQEFAFDPNGGERIVDLAGVIGNPSNAIDIGAVELQGQFFVVTQLADENDASDLDINTYDPNDLSLREAIALSNSTTDVVETIAFNFAGAGPHVINVNSALTAIVQPIVIDGRTQPGFTDSPVIAIDGASAGTTADGIQLRGSGSFVFGLAIHGFSGDGIEIVGGGDHSIDQNYIGLTTAGLAAANGFGVRIANSANNTLDDNVISGNASSGVFIVGDAAIGNTLTNNLIGVDPTGTESRPNAFDGVNLNAPDNIIGTPGNGNVISGNERSGVFTQTAGRGGNTIQSNLIGLSADGTTAIANLIGIRATNEDNLIGGAGSSQFNVISGNIAYGLELATAAATGNTVFGNRIGTNPAGDAAIGNGIIGVRLVSSPANIIGGTGDGEGNLISGNDGSGVLAAFVDADNNQIVGNRIGTNLDGTASIANTSDGVRLVQGASDNLVSDNQISGNLGRGVATDSAMGSRGNQIVSNLIGTDASGTGALHNGIGGAIRLLAPDSVVEDNVISAPDTGIAVIANANNFLIKDNKIGVTATGATTNLGMTRGIQVVGLVDRASTITGNVIANNNRGIQINSGTGIQIVGNSIYDNTVIGIDLGTDASTANDLGDNDTGANNLQNHPELSDVSLSGDQLTLTYLVDSTAQSSSYSMTIEFFVSDGNGQGKTSIATDVYTQSERRTLKTITLTVSDVNVGDEIVATATDGDGNTSEFGAFASVTDGSLTMNFAAFTGGINTDVNSDSKTTAIDALLVINMLAENNLEGESVQGQLGSRIYGDVNGDDRVTALDALLIINSLSRTSAVLPDDDGETAESEWTKSVDELLTANQLF